MEKVPWYTTPNDPDTKMEQPKNQLTSFLNKPTQTGPKVLGSPRPKVVPLSLSPRFFKLALFGGWATGKTRAIYDLVKSLPADEKIVILETDIGGSGLETIVNTAQDDGKQEVLDRILTISLSSVQEVEKFLDKPSDYIDWNENISWLIWEGFAMFHQLDVGEYVGEDLGVQRSSDNAKIDPAVEAGYKLEQNQWGVVRNITLRTLDHFLQVHNPITGRLLHKIVTMHEGTKSKPKTGSTSGGIEESHAPAIQGASGILAGGAFSVILRCAKKLSNPSAKLDRDRYKYVFQLSSSDNLAAKDRAYNLDAEEPGDLGLLWTSKISPRFVSTKGRTQ